MLLLSLWSIKLLRFENWNFSRVKKIAKWKYHLLHVSFFLILTRALEHIVCLGESRLSQVNNTHQANVFPAGVASFGKAMYWSLERSTQDTQDLGWIFFVQCPGLIFLVARWSGPATSASIFSAFLDYILWVCESLRDSFFYLGKLRWFLYLLLSYYYNPGMFIFCWSSNFVEKVAVEWGHSGEDGISCLLPCILLLYIECIWTNYCKLLWNFVGALRTTTTNCRVSFIDLYLVFPRNFRMVFLLLTNTVILLEQYCQWYYHKAWVTCNMCSWPSKC